MAPGIEVLDPMGRVPLSFIVDDSTFDLAKGETTLVFAS